MQRSESIAKLADALAKFQSEVSDPDKGGVNTFFKNGKGEGSKYVELDDLLQAVRPTLSKHGLSFVQSPGGDGQIITITTLLMHSSGEWIEFEPLSLKAVKTDPQGAGSAITYGRRYSLSAILGVAWDADDDGNKASGKEKNNNKGNKDSKEPEESDFKKAQETVSKMRQDEKKSSSDTGTKISESQVKSLYTKCTKEGLSHDDVHGVIKWKFGIESAKDLIIPDFAYLFNNIDKVWSDYVTEQSKPA